MRGKSDVVNPKEHVLDVAARLFYEHGVHVVGIERVQQESGVARATIYRHFPGKDALVVAFIERRDETWRSWLHDRVEALSPDRLGRPLAVFDAVAERVSAPGFRGCAFTNTIAEFPDPDHPAHVAARLHKAQVVDYLTLLCADANLEAPDEIARQLMILIDGAVVGAARDGNALAARTAQAAAAALLAANLSRPNQGANDVPTRHDH